MLPAAPPSTYILLRQFQKVFNNSDIALLKIFKRAFDYNISLIQQGQTIGNRPGAVQVVSYHNGCHLTLPLDLENQIVDLARADGVKACRGLVKKQYLRLQRERARQTYTFLHAARYIGRHLPKIAFHTHFREQLIHTFAALGAGHFFPMVYKGKRHIFSHGERIVKRCMLKQEAHLLPDFAHPVKSQADDILAMDANRSSVGCFEADDKPQQHTFSCATSSENGQGFSSAYAQANSVENHVASKCFFQVLNCDNRSTAVYIRQNHKKRCENH